LFASLEGKGREGKGGLWKKGRRGIEDFGMGGL